MLIMPGVLDFLKSLGAITARSVVRLKNNSPLLLAGSTAFFSLFSITPILIIIIQVVGMFYSPDKIRSDLYQKISSNISPETAEQLRGILESFHDIANKWYIAAIGFVALLFIASTLFLVIESALMQLWQIKNYSKQNFISRMKDRGFSLLLLIVASVLLVMGLIIDGMQQYFFDLILQLSPLAAQYLNGVFNHLISLLITVIWFAILFRYLTDARPEWKTVMAGGIFTGLLFISGKTLLRTLLLSSNVDTLYGASASLVLLLLFVFYSSLIFYLGGSFTIEWALFHHQKISTPEKVSFYKKSRTM